MSSILFLKTTAYGAVPYTYTATVNSTTAASQATTNSVDITFDYPVTNMYTTGITVYQTSGTASMKTPKILTYAIDSTNSNVLHLTIGALDPTVISYAIKIQKGALTFGSIGSNPVYTQLTDFILPFSSTDFASGFQSVFMNNSANNLNTNILNYNSPSDINLYVPKTYITSIQTTHKANGLITPTTTLPTTYPKLTSITIKTDPSVIRLKVSVTTSPANTTSTTTGTTATIAQLVDKELFSSSSSVGFTTGVAGLNIDTGKDYIIEVKAYDINGKLLQDFSHTEDVQTLETISNYVPKTSTSSNKVVTLYSLMSTQATLTSLLTSFDPANLDSIKVVYPNTGDTRLISNTQGQSNDAANVLAKALSDNNVQYIKFASALSITPTQDVKLARPSSPSENVVLDGTGSTINGNVTIGGGPSDTNIYDLRNLTITGNLTINLSNTGDCLLPSSVIVKGSTIITNKKNPEVTDVVSLDDKSLYGIGGTIRIGIKFSEPVFVVGSPILNVGVGVATYDDTSTQALVKSGITNEIVFDYNVKAGDYIPILSTSASALDLTNGDIQASEGASGISATTTGANSKAIYYSSSLQTNIVVDGVRPSLSGITVVNGSEIVYKASKLLDKVSSENTANWEIRMLDNTSAGFTDYTPTNAVLQGDNETVIMQMPTSIIGSFTNAAIGNNTASVFMTSAVTDKAGNTANDSVLMAQGSLGIAWHNSILGLPTGYKYEVIVGTGTTATTEYVTAGGALSNSITDALLAPGTTSITGLTNGQTYKVIEIASGQAQVEQDKSLTNITYTGVETNATVKSNITLPIVSTATPASTITWASTNPAVVITAGSNPAVSNTGVVTRPIYSAGDKTGVVTATIVNGTANDTKDFDITVLKKDFTATQSTFSDSNFTVVGDGYLSTDFSPASGSIEFTGGTTPTTWSIDGLTYTIGYVSTTGSSIGTATVTVSGTNTDSVASVATTKAITVKKDGQTRNLTLNIPTIVAGSTAANVAVTVTAN